MIDRRAPHGTSHLDVRVPAPGGRPAAIHVLGDGRAAWLGTPVGTSRAEGSRADRFEMDLVLPLGDGSPPVSLMKAALVDVGFLGEEVVGGPLCVSIGWRAASLAPLFPVFSGNLCWHDGQLHLVGFYAPPGGAMGVAADRVLLRVVAQRTARWLLGQVAVAIETWDGESAQSRSKR